MSYTVKFAGIPAGTVLEIDANADKLIVSQGWGRAETEPFTKRCLTFTPPDVESITAISIVTPPTYGNLVLRDNNTFALQLHEVSYNGADSFTYSVNYGAGAEEVTETYEIVKSLMDDGFSRGDGIMFPLDPSTGAQIIEHDENRRRIHIAQGGLSRAAIAALEGELVATITDQWIIDNVATGETTPYGETPALALDQATGFDVWNTLVGNSSNNGTKFAGHWLLLKNGETFLPAGRRIVPEGARGGNDRFPIVVDTYGGTDRAQVEIKVGTRDMHNVVMRNLQKAPNTDGTFGRFRRGMLENVDFNRQGTGPSGCYDGLTMYRVTGWEGWKDEANSTTRWSPFSDRVTQLFLINCKDPILIECCFDHSGWKQGFNALTNDIIPSGDFENNPHPPSQYSHSLYLKKLYGLYMVDCLLSRGAYTSAQMRAGGTIMRNLFLDSNGTGVIGAGEFDPTTDTYPYNFTQFFENVITSAGHKEPNSQNGLRGQSQGVSLKRPLTTIWRNIIAHLADPNNPAEVAAKTIKDISIQISNTLKLPFNDTITRNWDVDLNVGDKDLAVLDATTIQRFTESMLTLTEDTGTINGLIDHMKTLDNPAAVTKAAVDFFHTGFGVDSPARSATTLQFVGPEWADGFMWAVAANWSTGDIPGTTSGDSVDLNGFHTRLGPITCTIADLDFGNDGKVIVNNSQLKLATLTTTDGPARMEVERCGSVVITGTTAPANLLAVEISTDPDISYAPKWPNDTYWGGRRSAGRLSVDGALTGQVDFTVDQHGQLIAYNGGDITVGAGRTLTVKGSNTRVGFDGTNGAASVITMNATASLVIDGNSAGTPVIREQWSGRNMEAARSVASTFVCGGTLDLRGAASGTYDLITADTVSGTFATVIGGSVNGYVGGAVNVTVS